MNKQVVFSGHKYQQLGRRPAVLSQNKTITGTLSSACDNQGTISPVSHHNLRCNFDDLLCNCKNCIANVAIQFATFMLDTKISIFNLKLFTFNQFSRKKNDAKLIRNHRHRDY